LLGNDAIHWNGGFLLGRLPLRERSFFSRGWQRHFAKIFSSLLEGQHTISFKGKLRQLWKERSDFKVCENVF